MNEKTLRSLRNELRRMQDRVREIQVDYEEYPEEADQHLSNILDEFESAIAYIERHLR